MPNPKQFLTNAGEMSYFSLRAIASAFAPPYELAASLKQLEEIGARSVPLVAAAGLALGIVLTLHIRGVFGRFGALCV